ncbi:oxidoreductase, FAD-linked [Mycolicibacterium aurum]|uniref:Oxidoreductase, FAD-linked n=1 Tax=Mycolicibacterium aurum TaxID=1791 RepID=A0A448J177_MYCAU|nr:hypothetical protein [Mycolicibacterium aurum]VEG58536.1 oxidoreductase, FAD-linked [Mycolicibacterium aurum]
MTAQSDTDRLDNVAPGDVISLTPPNAPDGDAQQYKVVHTDTRDDPAGTTMIVTVESDDGQMRDLELPADTLVTRTLESKWESPQSPTPHDGTGEA